MRKVQSIRLTEFQKKALTRINAAANDKLAAEELSKGRNLRAARDLLVKLGMIVADEQTATITDKGTQLMIDHNLIDEMGDLTDDGKKFAYEKGEEPVENSTGSSDLAFESVSLIKYMNDEVNNRTVSELVIK